MEVTMAMIGCGFKIFTSMRTHFVSAQTVAPAPNDLLFPTETGTPYRIGNYLKRAMNPIAKKAGISDLTYQALRRTSATHFQRYGSPKTARLNSAIPS
jgi:integrase